MKNIIQIDGSFGEGGGQVLRSALTLSMCTGQPFRISRIRAGRKKPGLLRQHLTAVRAAAKICSAHVSGDEMRSGELRFEPGPIGGGKYRFAVGTAGSATLVLQTILPALLQADGPSELQLEGGTHNPFAPPFDFINEVYLPRLRQMGAKVEAEIERWGFYPAGGGTFRVNVEPIVAWKKLSIMACSEKHSIDVRAILSDVPYIAGEKELNYLHEFIEFPEADGQVLQVPSPGPGNALMVAVRAESGDELFTAFGAVNLPAKTVAKRVAEEVRAFLAAHVPVGTHLADQLLVPMALAGGGEFVTQPLSLHAQTNIEIIKKFINIPITVGARPASPVLIGEEFQ